MTTLEDSFLRDLEDLSDDSEAEEDERNAAIPENNEVITYACGLMHAYPDIV